MSILGVIVRTRPEHQAETQHAIAAWPGLDIATVDNGRFVVVIEDTATRSAAATMAQLSSLPQVLNTSLVYEYSGQDSPGPAEHIDGFQAWRRSPADPTKPLP